VAQALTRVARAMGYSVDAVDPGADRGAFPEADRVFTSLDEPLLRQRAPATGATLAGAAYRHSDYAREGVEDTEGEGGGGVGGAPPL
jgi:hypothetical protein